MRRLPALMVAAVLLACTVYEFALAAGAGSIGPEPGDDVAGAGLVGGVAAVAMLAGAAVAAVNWAWPTRAVALLAPSAALFLLAFWGTYDPYYAPDERRYSDGAMPSDVIALVLVLAFLVGGFARGKPRQGAAFTVVMMLAVLLATAVAGDGH